MLLPANMQAALQAMFGPGQCAGRVAALMGVGIEHKVLLAQGLNHVQHRLQVFVFDNGSHCRLARGVQVASGHCQYGLADKLHLVDGQ